MKHKYRFMENLLIAVGYRSKQTAPVHGNGTVPCTPQLPPSRPRAGVPVAALPTSPASNEDYGNFSTDASQEEVQLISHGPPRLGTIQTSSEATSRKQRAVVLPVAAALEVSGSSNPAKHARKDRGPKWDAKEILALVNAKRAQDHRERNTVDPRDLMIPDTLKRLQISNSVSSVGFSTFPRDGPTCKTKWNQIIPDYKQIVDFMKRSSVNMSDYWCMTKSGRKSEGLPVAFSEVVFHNIHEWYGRKPSIMPPHTRDLLSPEDSNFNAPVVPSPEERHVEPDLSADEDSMDVTQNAPPSADDSMRDTCSEPINSDGGSGRPVRLLSAGAGPSRIQRTSVPLNVNPITLSSSDNNDFNAARKTGNTGVRRKHLNGHNFIAEATKASGEVMATQMREMALASRELERTKIEVQLKVFEDQMEYQKQRDKRLLENARVTNDNARLAIEKQAQVVQCLASLSTVLNTGLLVSRGKAAPENPEIAAAKSDTLVHEDPPPEAAANQNDFLSTSGTLHSGRNA